MYKKNNKGHNFINLFRKGLCTKIRINFYLICSISKSFHRKNVYIYINFEIFAGLI